MIALSLAMERVVFRPLRGQTPAVMLVATFAVAFLLQSIALLAFGPLGKAASSLGYLNRPVTIGDVDIRKITIVAIVVAVDLPRCASCSCSGARPSGCTCARPRWTSARRACSASGRTA